MIYPRDDRPVAIITCESGNHSKHPLGFRDTILRNGWPWLARQTQHVIGRGYRRVLIAHPAGRYPGHKMCAAQYANLLPEAASALDAVLEVCHDATPGLYLGTEMWKTPDGELLPWCMGVPGSRNGARVDDSPAVEDYIAMFEPFLKMGFKELWLDAAGRHERKHAAVRFALWAWQTYEARVLLEPWPSEHGNWDTSTMGMVGCFALDGYVWAGVKEGRPLAPPGVQGLCLSPLGGPWSDDDLRRAGIVPVRYF